MEALNGLTIIGSLAIVLGEWDRKWHLVWAAVEHRRAAEVRNKLHEVRVELGDCHGLESKRTLAAVAAVADDSVMAKIEQDLDARAIGYRRGCEALRRNIKGRVPRMVEPWRVGEPVFADDLKIEMQR
jgi:hypothetical protein